jgi:MFS family permease
VSRRAASVEATDRRKVDAWPQFVLLATLTGFTGSIIGLERPILALIGVRQFHLVSHLAVLGFVISFGVAKATANLLAGRLADRFGRRRLLIAGWTLGLAEPLLIIAAPSWGWVVAANLLLGLQQGLCWTTLITMMIDRTRARDRGFATGINEFSGYTGVALAGFASGYLAARYGLRPAPFLPSFGFIGAGLGATLLGVHETGRPLSLSPRLLPGDLFLLPFRAVLRNPVLLGCSQAGLVANLLDAMIWGLLPIYFARHGLRLQQIGLIAGAYPLAWGLSQALSGPLSDRLGRRLPIAAGMAGQGAAIAAFLLVNGFRGWLVLAVAIGISRALAYPTLLAAAADSGGDRWRGSALGVYRFYRDSGFVAGGVLGGVLADRFGIAEALAAAAALALVSSAIAAVLIAATVQAQGERWASIDAAADQPSPAGKG